MDIILLFYYQLGNWIPEELGNSPKAKWEGQSQNGILKPPHDHFWNWVS